MGTASYLHPHHPHAATLLLQLLSAFPAVLARHCLGCHTAADGVEPEEVVLARCGGTTPSLILTELHMVLSQMMQLQREPAAMPSESKVTTSTNDNDNQTPISTGNNAHLALHSAALAGAVDELVAAVGACERIIKVPMPLCYTRHTSRFLTVWTSTLPFVLVAPLGLATVPVMLVASWALFGIEEVGHLIEQPFVDHRDPAYSLSSGSVRPNEPYDYSLPVYSLAAAVTADIRIIANAADMTQV
eukprot:CAMPEP_0115854202 /NCGR_PEP_ID=MMETSP0287-20121206/13903_1 /TAXON_ID=412157 /ORGANISM="Chrysochromulina rotalis, Strain UIO044" /LENGTH=244 /DNA_ID=CAMNT_0003308313 /DNA_START=459 /DNA_END=1193 /DNA_ORIENTATION=-